MKIKKNIIASDLEIESFITSLEGEKLKVNTGMRPRGYVSMAPGTACISQDVCPMSLGCPQGSGIATCSNC